MAAPAATTATPPFASRQRGGEGLFALKSLASARPARARPATLSSRAKASPFCREVEDSCGRGVRLLLLLCDRRRAVRTRISPDVWCEAGAVRADHDGGAGANRAFVGTSQPGAEIEYRP